MSYSWLEDLLLLGVFSQELIVMLAAYALVDFTFFLSIEVCPDKSLLLVISDVVSVTE